MAHEEQFVPPPATPSNVFEGYAARRKNYFTFKILKITSDSDFIILLECCKEGVKLLMVEKNEARLWDASSDGDQPIADALTRSICGSDQPQPYLIYDRLLWRLSRYNTAEEFAEAFPPPCNESFYECLKVGVLCSYDGLDRGVWIPIPSYTLPNENYPLVPISPPQYPNMLPIPEELRPAHEPHVDLVAIDMGQAMTYVPEVDDAAGPSTSGLAAKAATIPVPPEYQMDFPDIKRYRKRKTGCLPHVLKRTNVDEAFHYFGMMARNASSESDSRKLKQDVEKFRKAPPCFNLNHYEIRRGYYKAFVAQQGIRPSCSGTYFGMFLDKLVNHAKRQEAWTFKEAKMQTDLQGKHFFNAHRQAAMQINGQKRNWLQIGSYFLVAELDAFNQMNVTKVFLWVIAFN